MRKASVLLVCFILITIMVLVIIPQVSVITSFQAKNVLLHANHYIYCSIIARNVTPLDPGSGEGGNTYQYRGDNNCIM